MTVPFVLAVLACVFLAAGWLLEYRAHRSVKAAYLDQCTAYGQLWRLSGLALDALDATNACLAEVAREELRARVGAYTGRDAA
jgi:hypothetical protein